MNTNRFLVGSAVFGLVFTQLFAVLSVRGQERIEPVPFGDFEYWSEQQIKESALIGGQMKTLYKIGGPWSSSNAHARALGVDKVSVSVTPEKRGDGYCCRMENILEIVKAIGIDFKALATGSIYTGKLLDIVGLKHSSDPNSAIDMGTPFSGRPSALILDYKALIQDKAAVYAAATTSVKEVSGHDVGRITLLLQHRWEKDGHVYAYRVGTAVHLLNHTTDWQNDYRIPILYGQAGKESKQLLSDSYKTYNGDGKMVYIEEVDFCENVPPTHLIIQIVAGSMPPFTGCPGNVVWCDNIRLAYDE